VDAATAARHLELDYIFALGEADVRQEIKPNKAGAFLDECMVGFCWSSAESAPILLRWPRSLELSTNVIREVNQIVSVWSHQDMQIIDVGQ